jgi:hypothetical protein
MYLKLYDVSTYYVVLGYVLLAVSLASVNPGRCHRHTVHWTVISKKETNVPPVKQGYTFTHQLMSQAEAAAPTRASPSLQGGVLPHHPPRRPDSMSARLVVSCRTTDGLT